MRIGDRIAERGREVALGALEVIAPGRHRDAALGFELRLLGDDGHGAAGLAATEQRRAGSLQHLDPLDGRGIANSAEAAPAVETVDEIARGDVEVAREAADREAVPHAAECVLAGHARSQIERVIEADHANFLQQSPLIT